MSKIKPRAYQDVVVVHYSSQFTVTTTNAALVLCRGRVCDEKALREVMSIVVPGREREVERRALLELNRRPHSTCFIIAAPLP